MELTYIDHSGSDLMVVNAARVSFRKKSSELSAKDVKLINYLASNGHTSPFNHCFLTCHVRAPIFVARQLVKHKFMPWNEMSRRYVDDELTAYFPETWRAKSEDKKQGSSSETVEKIDVYGENADPSSEATGMWNLCRQLHQNMIESGICPEQARMVLPLNTYTEWFWSGTLGAWMNMYKLRSSDDAQAESREIAIKAGSVLKELYPSSFKALTS